MLKGILEFLFGTNIDPVYSLVAILTAWAIIFIGIASFFQIKTHLESKKEAKRVATEVAAKEAAKSVNNLETALLTRLAVVTDLSSEFSEYRGNSWTKLANALFAVIDDPSINITDEAKERIREKFDVEKQGIFNISYELSYLLQLFDRDAERRGAARAYVRDHIIKKAIRMLQLQIDTADFEGLSQDERDDIIRTIKEIEK